LTSVKAEENLRARRSFREESLRDGTLDSEAAAIILSDFLENADREFNELGDAK
jgi:RNase H-fold protein (predicted Holliday junction resolvase)